MSQWNTHMGQDDPPISRRRFRKSSFSNLPSTFLTKSTKAGLTALGLSFIALLIIWKLTIPDPSTATAMDAQVIVHTQQLPNPPSYADHVSGGRNPVHSLWSHSVPVKGMDALAAHTDNNVFKSANLFAAPVPESILKLRSAIHIDENRVEALDLKIFYREAKPPADHYTKGEIFLLHGQAFTSANWLEKQAIQTFAAAGYRVVAVDLPGYGQTGGRTLSPEEKPKLIEALIDVLNLNMPVLVSPSMSGAYSIPYMMSHAHKLSAFIPVAPVSTGDFSAAAYRKTKLPTLIVYGERDTSLGILSASNLKALPNGRVLKIPSAGHACYLNNPDAFHSSVLNFLDLVQSSRPTNS